MINYKNNDIKEVHYKGFDITQMYACSGNLVWEKEIPDGDYLTFVASSSGVFSCTANVKYSKNGSWWHTLAANGSIDVNSGDVIKWKGNVIPAPNGACRFGNSTAQFAVSGNPLSLILGDNFEGVTSLDGYDYAFEYMFTNCSGLTSIDGLSLPFTTISARCYRAMFAHCTSLTSIPSILSAATVMKEKCYMNMFLGCTNLTSVPNDLLPSTTLAESCYYGMFAQSGIIDAEGLELPATTLALSAYTMMFQRATSLEKAPILSAATLVDDCYHSMFYGCSSLSAITCLATSISASNCVFDWVNGVAPSGEFRRESAMTDWQVDSINGIPVGWSVIPPLAFKLKATYTDGKSYNLDCNASNTLSTSETHPSGYDYTKMKDAEIGSCTNTIGAYAFSASPITSITIGSGVTAIGDGAFLRCSGLTSVTIPNSVTSISGTAFVGCSSLVSVNIPSGVTTINPSTFGNCYSLSSITIPSGVTTINQGFRQCSGLTSVNFEKGTEPLVISGNAFSRCTSLERLEIPDRVTVINGDDVSSNEGAFSGCSSLTSLTIGSGVTIIGKESFWLCSGLTSITINAINPPTLKQSNFGRWPFDNTNNCPIYVPCESVEAYKAAAGWRTYASRIQAIS